VRNHATTGPQMAPVRAGLDQYQVRSWRTGYAHITLSMLALAWLADSRARAEKGVGTSDPGMIGHTSRELRRLLISLTQAGSPGP
jgi:SRSO17 transposase